VSPSTAPVFAALGDELRLRLVAQLGAAGPLSIARLTAETDVTRQAITRHLEVLAQAGLAHSVRSGRERLWQLDRPGLDEARRFLDDLSRQWDDALGRLKTSVEGEGYDEHYA
jgi:DNA-binding transcriptional ArsR family regulator